MTIGVVGNNAKPDVASAVGSLLAILDARRIEYILDTDMREVLSSIDSAGHFVEAAAMRERADVVIAFGGDGTMLAASRLLVGSGVPLLGVNLGRLGFLAEFSVDALDEMIEELVNQRVQIVERGLLQATFPDNPAIEPLIALNDIVIDKSAGSRMVVLETSINGDFLGTYRGDGLIFATPTGSTAYALSAGGPVVSPNCDVTVIAPIAPHMLTARPVVVPDRSIIEVIPILDPAGRDGVHIYADGQVHRNMPTPSKVTITRYEATASLVKRTSTTYFDVLRAKLLWGREPVLKS
ncbi:MAG: NAD(+)/NADH kinase [bacterium]|nr:NAD(+)/NADH kinase [Candidatus Kapabacteria bacterium]